MITSRDDRVLAGSFSSLCETTGANRWVRQLTLLLRLVRILIESLNGACTRFPLPGGEPERARGRCRVSRVVRLHAHPSTSSQGERNAPIVRADWPRAHSSTSSYRLKSRESSGAPDGSTQGDRPIRRDARLDDSTCGATLAPSGGSAPPLTKLWTVDEGLLASEPI